MLRFLAHMVSTLLLALAALAAPQANAENLAATFPKVVFVNDDAELLLAFDSRREAYEVPASDFVTGPTSFRQYIDRLAQDIGVTYDAYRLGGIFTYLFPDRDSAYIRPYFVVPVTGYVNGEGVADDRYRWFVLDDAIREIKYPASSHILGRIMRQPGHVWSATFEEHGYTNPVDVSKITFRVIEDFHRID